MQFPLIYLTLIFWAIGVLLLFALARSKFKAQHLEEQVDGLKIALVISLSPRITLLEEGKLKPKKVGALKAEVDNALELGATWEDLRIVKERFIGLCIEHSIQ